MFCQWGSSSGLATVLFQLMRGGGGADRITTKGGPSLALQQNAILMALRCRVDNGQTLKADLIAL